MVHKYSNGTFQKKRVPIPASFHLGLVTRLRLITEGLLWHTPHVQKLREVSFFVFLLASGGQGKPFQNTS